MSPVNSMFVCIKKLKIKRLSANLFLKWPISIIGKMLNIGADNRSTPRFVVCTSMMQISRSTTSQRCCIGLHNREHLWDVVERKICIMDVQHIYQIWHKGKCWHKGKTVLINCFETVHNKLLNWYITVILI